MRGNARQLEARARYREYIKSPRWRARRERWEAEHLAADPGTAVQCFVCADEWKLTRDDLHHCSYNQFESELHDDLWPVHRGCHSAIHLALRQCRPRVKMRLIDKNKRVLRDLRQRFSTVPQVQRRAAVAAWVAAVAQGRSWHDCS